MRGLLALLCCLPASLTGQDSARVVVQYVAGANVYLGGGTAAQIRTGDTLTARKVPSGEQVTPSGLAAANLALAPISCAAFIAFSTVIGCDCPKARCAGT